MCVIIRELCENKEIYVGFVNPVNTMSLDILLLAAEYVDRRGRQSNLHHSWATSKYNNGVNCEWQAKLVDLGCTNSC